MKMTKERFNELGLGFYKEDCIECVCCEEDCVDNNEWYKNPNITLCEALNHSEFALNKVITPSYYYKIATNGKELLKEPSLEELRSLMDENGLEGELWDYPEDELDEALENNDIVVAVEFNEENGHFVRIFECTEEMASLFAFFEFTEEMASAFLKNE